MQTEYCQDSVKKKLSTEKTKKDKFKPHFCGKDFYVRHQSEFIAIHAYTRHLPLKNRLIIYTIALCCLRRKTDWFAGVLPEPRLVFTQYPENQICFSVYQLFRTLHIQWPKALSLGLTFYDFLSLIKIKPIPEAALSGIFHFYVGDYNLEILCYEPLPLEILNLQIQNKRVLTFEDNFAKWPDIKYGARDVLSFLLHDFIHAEHFLSDPQKRLGQIGFYRFIQKILTETLLDPYFVSVEFNKQFSYLISDMNSHVIHLLKTFKAILDEQNFDPKIWTKLCQLIPDAHTLKLALNKINTPLFSSSDAVTALQYFENEYNQTLKINQ